MIEEWKLSKSSPFIEISNKGNVRSIDRVQERTSINGVKYNQKIAGKQLTPTLNRAGYLEVSTSVNGVRVRFKIHQEVCRVWNGDSENELLVVDHIDRDKLNNTKENLRWVSRSENVSNCKSYSGRTARRFTGSVIAIDCLSGLEVAIMSGNADMASKGFDYRLVSAVLKGKRKTHRGCTFLKLNDTLQPIVSLDDFELWSKSNWANVVALSLNTGAVTTISSMESLVDLGFTPIHVLQCLKGKSLQHKEHQFILEEKYLNEYSTKV